MKTAPVKRLSRFVAPAFWDRRFGTLSWERDRDFIVRRLLIEDPLGLAARIRDSGIRLEVSSVSRGTPERSSR